MSGNLEIGNGYGVPGGCASYGASKPGIVANGLELKTFFLLLDFDVDFQLVHFIFVLLSGNNVTGQKIQGQVKEVEQSSAAKALPEYLKQKLRARGILKEDAEHSNPVRADVRNFLKHVLAGLLSFII